MSRKKSKDFMFCSKKNLRRSFWVVSMTGMLVSSSSVLLASNPVLKQLSSEGMSRMGGVDMAVAVRIENDKALVEDAVMDDRQWIIQGQVMENTEPPYPLAGVNIVIKGTTIGAISDNNGYFSIKAKRGDVLVFKYVGFKDYEYVVSREISNLTVSLTAESAELDAVVITGLSEEKKLNSISSVSALDVTQNLTT